MSKSVATRISQVWTRNSVLFWLLANDKKRQQDKAMRVLHSFTQSVVQARRQQLELTSGADSVVERCEDGVKRKQALLDILLKSTIDGVALSERDIQEEVDTFMFEVQFNSFVIYELHIYG